MPKKPNESPIVCKYFTWYLRRKLSGVYYADGRMNTKFKPGKPSLSTKDREQALRNLQLLDEQMAIDVGLIKLPENPAQYSVSIKDGWKLYMDRCEQPEILEGVRV